MWAPTGQSADITGPRHGHLVAGKCSSTSRRCGLERGHGASSLWNFCGLFRTWPAPVCGLCKDFCGSDVDISKDMGRTQTRTGQGRGLPADIACSLPDHGHGLDMDGDSQAGQGADIPRSLRDHFADTEYFAGEGVGLALGLNMTGNVFLLLFK
jgi:hypothetical protein